MMEYLKESLLFAAFISGVLLLLVLFGVPDKKAWLKGEGKGALASAAKGIVVVLLGGFLLSWFNPAKAQSSVFDTKYGSFFNYAYTYIGVDYTRKVSPQCVPGSTNDRFTSNMGFGVNFWQSPGKDWLLDIRHTHHSCVIGHDRNGYDGVGFQLQWIPLRRN